MQADTNRESFGSYLQAFRLKQALSLEAVSRRTRIAPHCLAALEADDSSRLPPRAYVKSFIRAYAETVGANPDVALNLYLTELERQAIARQQQLRRQANLSMLRRGLITIGLITSILLLVRYTNLLMEPEPAAGPSVLDHDPLAGTAAEPASREGESPLPVTAPEKLKLKVIAVEQTWLKVMVDGQNTRSYTLKPEERLELEANRSFNLMIGNATGLQMFLNERPVKIYGSSGQIVSLKIP